MQFGVGLEGVDIPACTEKGIKVCNIASDKCANALSCAEHAIFLVFAVLRNYNGLLKSIDSKIIGYPTARTLFGCNVLLLGYGGIGKELAKRLVAFDVHLHLLVSNVNKYSQNFDRDIAFESIVDITSWSRIGGSIDIIFICCTQNPTTLGLINKEFLSHLKKGAIIINIARGGIINYDDLYNALIEEKISGLGLDVYHTEPFPSVIGDRILSHANVICTPHVAGVSELSYRQMAEFLGNNIQNIIENKPLSGQVN